MTRGVSLPAPVAALTLFVGRRRPARRRSADGPLRLAPVWRGGIWARPPAVCSALLGGRVGIRFGLLDSTASGQSAGMNGHTAGRPRHLLLVRHKNA